MSTDPFLSPGLSIKNMDRYVMRAAILNALKASLPNFSGNLLDIGAGNHPYRELLTSPNSNISHYTPLDLKNSDLSYEECEYTWDGKTMPFQDNLFDCAMATEVLEHCPDPEVLLREAFRILKPDGIFFFTVPFLWPLHDAPHDEYRYTPWALERHLKNCDFDMLEIYPTGGWDASLAQAIGLWVRRRPMGRLKRAVLSSVLFPFFCLLNSADKPLKKFHYGQYLMPGIAGIVRKPLL